MRTVDAVRVSLKGIVVLSLVTGISVGCGKKSDDDDDDRESVGATGGNGGGGGGGGGSPDAPESVLALFKDTDSIDPAALASGPTDCLEIDAQASFGDAVEPWPAELKGFLAAELARFPQFALVEGAVAGIYLAKPEMLAAGGLPEEGTVAGIMCAVGGEQRGYVFLNYDNAVTMRQAKGPLGAYQEDFGAVHPHVLTQHGDQAVYTMIHEIFHAIDQAYFSSSGSADQVAGRAEVHDLAWNDSGDSLDERVEIFALNGKRPRHICSSRGFNLTPETAEEMAAAYRQLAEETNFISPYAQSNSFEDFADTLSTWYFRMTYDNGLVRSVYSNDLTQTPIDESQLLFKFDTKEILNTSARHQTKMCAMVDLVFDAQDCMAQITD